MVDDEQDKVIMDPGADLYLRRGDRPSSTEWPAADGVATGTETGIRDAEYRRIFGASRRRD